MVQDQLKPAWYESLLDRNLVPDPLIRVGIRRLLRERLKQAATADPAHLIDQVHSSPVAINTNDANRQHYEVPPQFFALTLGTHRKYSSCYWPEGVDSLDNAERVMLDLTVERASLEDGQSILELGCGWGSLSLYMAQRFPRSQVLGVSNSQSQREYIEEQARNRGLINLRIVTCDMNCFDPGARFDRVVSVEMFEHMRNYQELLRRIASWLKPEGKLFVHIFSHKRFAYPFEVSGPNDWMAQHFFTGGIMPSHGLIRHVAHPFQVEADWRWNGDHYRRTAEDWLVNFDQNVPAIEAILTQVYGADAMLWKRRWRLFFQLRPRIPSSQPPVQRSLGRPQAELLSIGSTWAPSTLDLRPRTSIPALQLRPPQ